VFGSRDARAHATELVDARSRIAELEERLAEVSSRDMVVPDLLSLVAFRGRLEVDVERAHRHGRPLAVALVDIDGFRDLNLKHGYAAGDAVLAAVGAAITRCVRSSDIACRTGGDEFAVLFSEAPSSPAVRAIERVITELAVVEAGGVNGVSASAGVAELTASERPEALLAHARDGLEAARSEGGGRVRAAAPNGTAGSRPVGSSVT
jgi:diguanylate cyclase (GGDEF)-like protein